MCMCVCVCVCVTNDVQLHIKPFLLEIFCIYSPCFLYYPTPEGHVYLALNCYLIHEFKPILALMPFSFWPYSFYPYNTQKL